MIKAKSFYIWFSIAEVYGMIAFWYCVYKLKKDIEAADVKLEEIKSTCCKSCCCVENQDIESQEEQHFVTTDLNNNELVETESLSPSMVPLPEDCKLNYFSDDVRQLVFLMTGEIPLLMILEYFYVERPLGSDGFFDNYLIATNNILTSIEIVFLLMATIDMVVDNVGDSEDRPIVEAKGIGSPDGRLNLFEASIIQQSSK